MNFTIERITEINYPAFADMTYWRKNGTERKCADGGVGEKLIREGLAGYGLNTVVQKSCRKHFQT